MNKGLLRIFLFCLTFNLFTAKIVAQNASNSDLILRELSIEKDWPTGIINSVSETNNGLIGLCTNQGLMEYDGFNFRDFFEKYPKLSEYKYMSCRLAVFNGNTLYLSFIYGWVAINLETGSVIKKIVYKGHQRIIFMHYHQGHLYVFLRSGEILKINAQNLQPEKQFKMDFIKNVFVRNEKEIIIVNHKGSIYSLFYNDSFIKQYQNHGAFDYHNMHFNSKGKITGVSDLKGQLIYGDSQNSIAGALKRYYNAKNKMGINTVPEVPVLQTLSFKNEFTLVLTQSSLYFVNPNPTRNRIFLPTISARAMHKISETDFIASVYNGLYRISKNGTVKEIDKIITASFSIRQSRFNKNLYYVLGSGNGLFEYNAQNNTFTRHRDSKKGEGFNCGIYINDSISLILGSTGYYLNEKSNTLVNANTIHFKHNTAYDIYVINDAEYLTINANGLYKINTKKHQETAIRSGAFKWYYKLNSHTLLMSILGEGLVKFDLNNYKFSDYKLPDLNKNAGLFVYSYIYFEKRNEFIIGTSDGLYRVDLQKAKATRINTLLREFNTASLLAFDDTTLYAGGVNGIEEINLNLGKVALPYPYMPEISEIKTYFLNGETQTSFFDYSKSFDILPQMREMELFITTPMDFMFKEYYLRYRFSNNETWITKLIAPG